MMEINLQLFGGGGSKSGLGKGGGGSGNGKQSGSEDSYYTFGFTTKDGRKRTQTFKAKTLKDAEKKADKYKNDEGYNTRSPNYVVRTKEEYDEYKSKSKKK